MSSGRLVPAVPSCILDPLREEFLALLPPHVDEHPLGCHRRRIDDAVELAAVGVKSKKRGGSGSSRALSRVFCQIGRAHV